MKPDPSTPYGQLGGEDGIRQLVRRFYELMDTLPEAWDVRQMHPEDLSGSEEKLFKYLSGWLGGPPLYEQEFGHPRLRARHMPFAIGTRERDQWVACMLLAMEEVGIAEPMRERLLQSFFKTADFMRNQPG